MGAHEASFPLCSQHSKCLKGAGTGRPGQQLLHAAPTLEAGYLRFMSFGTAQRHSDHEHTEGILISDALLAGRDVSEPITVGLSAFLAVGWCCLDA